MRTPISNWTPWYVGLQKTTKMQCLVCGEDFTKKNSRMLSHLGYIPSTGVRDSNVKLCKNVKPDVCVHFVNVAMQPLLHRNLRNRNIFKVVRKVNVATHDRVFPYYAPNSSIKHSKSDSKDRSQEIL
jgi:hypothetical protein